MRGRLSSALDGTNEDPLGPPVWASLHSLLMFTSLLEFVGISERSAEMPVILTIRKHGKN